MAPYPANTCGLCQRPIFPARLPIYTLTDAPMGNPDCLLLAQKARDSTKGRHTGRERMLALGQTGILCRFDEWRRIQICFGIGQLLLRNCVALGCADIHAATVVNDHSNVLLGLQPAGE